MSSIRAAEAEDSAADIETFENAQAQLLREGGEVGVRPAPPRHGGDARKTVPCTAK